MKVLHLVWLTFLVAIDLASKYAVQVYVSMGEQIEVTSFFNIVYVWNRGVSFGMFQAQSNFRVFLLVFLALVVILWLVKFYFDSKSNVQKLFTVTIIAGALANVIDRLINGAVFDFLDFYYQTHHWPAFNIADCCVVSGVFLLFLSEIFIKKKKV